MCIIVFIVSLDYADVHFLTTGRSGQESTYSKRMCTVICLPGITTWKYWQGELSDKQLVLVGIVTVV